MYYYMEDKIGFKKVTITLSEDRYEEINKMSKKLNKKKSKLISKAL